ncbi:uncharacterized protein LOC119629142 isoform X2 [Bombyx mori]|uniref:Uncharacterized protein n=1 Tax=Bombyx mori TaxID=7091 RepID=A0A8R2LZ33_BOMMO|nr:uncharacterized protein LOC119629142 isoform X2 [Bombyx mori]
MERRNSCVSCERSVLRRRRHRLTQMFLERYHDYAVLLLQEIMPREIAFDGTLSICNPCWLRFYRAVQVRPVDDPLPQQVQEPLNEQIPLHENFNSAHVLDIIELYEWRLERGTQLDFENVEEIDDNELHFYTGMDKIQFNNILNQTSSLRDRTNSSATVLGLYLVKIRTGEPDERIASMFNMSRRTLVRKLKIARECLSEEFVPRHLGLDHMTREDVVARNLTIPSHIFGGNQNEPAAILVCVMEHTYTCKKAPTSFFREERIACTNSAT